MNVQQEIKDQILYYKSITDYYGEDLKLSILYMRCPNNVFEQLIKEIEEEIEEEIDHTPFNFMIAIDGVTIKVNNNHVSIKFQPYYVPSKN